jgi:alanine or glycine:cation symporter, AGCS family
MQTLQHVLEQLNGVIWSWPNDYPAMIILLLGTGIFLTIRLGFINFRAFGHAIRVVKGDYDDPDHAGDITHFQALTTALSATVGIGNIAGVATAIHYGGPGALFWMWLTAIVGMTTKYVECTLAQEYRVEHADGSVSGGPMYYIEKGIGKGFRPMAIFFAACAVISSMGSGNAVQAFTMADSFRADFNIPTWITGAVAATLVALVILGGIKRIGNVTSKIMPAMAGIYFLGALMILILNAGEIPGAFGAIVAGAMQPSAALGGFAGATFVFTLTWGVKRGLFSNEAGQGSAPIAHAAARTDEPVREGAVALLGPAIDTMLICTLTGLVIIVTGVWKDQKESTYPLNAQSNVRVVHDKCIIGRGGELAADCKITGGRSFALVAGRLQGARLVLNDNFVNNTTIKTSAEAQLIDGKLEVSADGGLKVIDDRGAPQKAMVHGLVSQNASLLTAWAFERGLSPIFPFGGQMVTLCVFLFAISTAIGWSYYGDRSIRYIFGPKSILPYKLAFVAMHFMGAVFSLDVVWGFGDAALGLMAFPNLLAILMLSNKVSAMTKEYFSRKHVPYKDR